MATYANLPAPSEFDLLRYCGANVTDEIMERLASWDRAAMAEGHSDRAVLDMLRRATATTTFSPEPQEFEFHECLCLCTNGTHSRNMSMDAHLERLFASCLLHHVGVVMEDCGLFAHDGTMARMVESAIVVGPEACAAAASYVAWLAEHDDEEYSRAFHVLSGLFLRLAQDRPADPDTLPRLEDFWRQDCPRLLDVPSLDDAPEDTIARVDGQVRAGQRIWLLCLDEDGSQYDPWRRLARAHLPDDDSDLGELRRRLDPPGRAAPNPLA